MTIANKPTDSKVSQTTIAVKTSVIIVCETIKSGQTLSKGLRLAIANQTTKQTKDNQ